MAENKQKKGHTTEQSGCFLRCAPALHKTRLKASPSRYVPGEPTRATPAASMTWPHQPLGCSKHWLQLCHLPWAGDSPWIALTLLSDMGSADPDPTCGPMAQPGFSLSPRMSLCLRHCPTCSPSKSLLLGQCTILCRAKTIPPPNCCSYSGQLP